MRFKLVACQRKNSVANSRFRGDRISGEIAQGGVLAGKGSSGGDLVARFEKESIGLSGY